MTTIFTRRSSTYNRFFVGCVIATVMAIAGGLAIKFSYAQTATASVEAESGVVAGKAAKSVSNPTGASGGTVQFGSSYRQDFLYRVGKQVMLNGAPFKFVGFNNFGLTGCDSGNVAPSQSDLDDYFSRLRPKSVTRTWAFESVNHTAIDNVIKAAEKYDQKLILALGEGAGYCGAPHYRRAWYQSEYKGAYFTWIQSTVSKYKDSPAVIWEIMNEAGQASGPGGTANVTADGDGMTLAEMKSFYTNTAAQIKKYDPNHLISSGAISTSRTYHKGQAGYEAIHSSPNIDLVSAHEYHYLLYGLAGLNKFWTEEKAAADALGKPIFDGEFGALPDGCQTSAQRSTIIKGKYDAYLNAGAVGALYFAVGKPGKTGSQCGSIDDGTYNTVDAYTEPLFSMTKSYTNSNLPTPK
jgi:mannan endo-1,4-beta-mannosidase